MLQDCNYVSHVHQTTMLFHLKKVYGHMCLPCILKYIPSVFASWGLSNPYHRVKGFSYARSNPSHIFYSTCKLCFNHSDRHTSRFSHLASKLSWARNFQLSCIPVLHRPNIVTHRYSIEYFQMFPAQSPVVRQSTDPFTMFSSCCHDLFDCVDKLGLVPFCGQIPKDR